MDATRSLTTRSLIVPFRHSSAFLSTGSFRCHRHVRCSPRAAIPDDRDGSCSKAAASVQRVARSLITLTLTAGAMLSPSYVRAEGPSPPVSEVPAAVNTVNTEENAVVERQKEADKDSSEQAEGKSSAEQEAPKKQEAPKEEGSKEADEESKAIKAETDKRAGDEVAEPRPKEAVAALPLQNAAEEQPKQTVAEAPSEPPAAESSNQGKAADSPKEQAEPAASAGEGEKESAKSEEAPKEEKKEASSTDKPESQPEKKGAADGPAGPAANQASETEPISVESQKPELEQKSEDKAAKPAPVEKIDAPVEKKEAPAEEEQAPVEKKEAQVEKKEEPAPEKSEVKEEQVPAAPLDQSQPKGPENIPISKISSTVALDFAVEGKPAGTVTLRIYEQPPLGTHRFLDLARRKAGGYKLNKVDGISDAYITISGVLQLNYSGMPKITGGETVEQLQAEQQVYPRSHDKAGIVSLIVEDAVPKDMRERVVAYEGKLIKVQEVKGAGNANGTGLAISLKPAPELDRTTLVIGEVIDGLDVIERISKLPKVKSASQSPFFKVAKALGDRRADVAARSFGKPLGKVVIQKVVITHEVE